MRIFFQFNILFLLNKFFLTFGSIAPNLIAKFQVDSVSAHSIVIKIIGVKKAPPLIIQQIGSNSLTTTNRIKLEMKVTIFDLEKLREFRKSELTSTLVNLEHSQVLI